MEKSKAEVQINVGYKSHRDPKPAKYMGGGGLRGIRQHNRQKRRGSWWWQDKQKDRKGRVTKGDTQLEISGTASSAGAGDVGQAEGGGAALREVNRRNPREETWAKFRKSWSSSSGECLKGNGSAYQGEGKIRRLPRSQRQRQDGRDRGDSAPQVAQKTGGHLAAGRQDRDFKVEAQSHFAEAGKRSHLIHDHKPESEPGLRHLYTEHAHSEHRKREANWRLQKATSDKRRKENLYREIMKTTMKLG